MKEAKKLGRGKRGVGKWLEEKYRREGMDIRNGWNGERRLDIANKGN